MEQVFSRHADVRELRRVPTVLPKIEQVDLLVRDAMSLISPLRVDVSSTVSHCIRTPLTTLLGVEEIVRKGMPMTELERESFLQIVLFESARLRRFVEMLTWFDEMERGTFVLRTSHKDVRETVSRAIRSFDPGVWAKRVSIVVNPQSAKMFVLADHDRLKHVFEQLLQNAFHVSPLNGEIRIGFRLVDENIEIQVSNSGPALNAADRERIFNAFERIPHSNDTGGELGLGLTIVRMIAQEHGGSVSCYSGSPTGMSFVISLPR